MVKKRKAGKGSGKRSNKRIWILYCVFFVSLVVFWQGGFFGYWILTKAVPAFLTVDLDDGFSIDGISLVKYPVIPERGLRISIRPDQLKSLLKASSPLFAILPPGIITDSVTVKGSWVSEKEGGEHVVPITINLSDETGVVPVIAFRYPIDDFNALLQAELAEDWRDEDEYFLGTYTRGQRIWFDSISIKSKPNLADLPDAPILFTIEAKGRLRYEVNDGPVGARITAKVKKLSGTIELIPEKHSKGVGFGFKTTVDALDLSVKKMAPWLEKKFAKDLKNSLERSMNKRRRRKEFAQMRVPYWVPLDINIDIELTDADDK